MEVAETAVLAAELPAKNGPPEWVQIMPIGAVTPGDGRAPWRLDNPGSVIADSLAAASGGVIPIDYDHAVDLAAPKGGRAPAAGWITDLAIRDGFVWARVDWTEAGGRAVAAREYRFLSPSFLHTKDRRITRIVGAGLVNRPALPQLAQLASHGANMNEFHKRLIAALGLPETADEDAIMEAVAELVSGMRTTTASAIPNPNLYVPRNMYDAVATAAAKARADASQAQITAKVDHAIVNGKITPAQREWALALCRQDLDGFDGFIQAAPPVFAHLSRQLAPGGTPDVEVTGSLSAQQQAVCSALALNPADYAKTR